MDINKKDTLMAQGTAILMMVAVHLFAKKGIEVYGVPLIWIKPDVPLVYYLGFLSGIALPFYCYCTGYALYTQFGQEDLKTFYRKMCFRLIKFLIHFWLICVLFSVVGFFFDIYREVPGNWSKFVGNFFMLEHTYNGAWWFAPIYIIFSLISPLFIKMTKKLDSRILFLIFSIIFCSYYLCNMKHLFEVAESEYYWKGFFLRKGSDFWRLLFLYVVGMIFAKEQIVCKIRERLSKKERKSTNLLILILTVLLSIAACVIEKTILMYFFSVLYFLFFHLWTKSEKTEKFFCFWGKHSTNIWLIHMFFYLYIFKNFVFILKEPLLSYIFMLFLCVGCSYGINFILKMLWKSKVLSRVARWGSRV